MPRKGLGEKVQQAATGMQELLRLDQVSISTDDLGKTLLELGAISGNGDYYCDVDVSGLSAVEIHVRATATATTTPSAYTTYADGVTSKTALTDSGAGVLVNGVARTFSISTLKGEKLVRFKFVIAGGGNVTFDRAEYNGA